MGRRKKTKEKLALIEGETKDESLEFDAARVEKDYIEIFNYQRKTRNNLLGDFSGGKYEIKDETILKKLFEIPKKFDSLEGQTAYFSQKLDEFVLSFKAEFDISESYCTAKLYLIETESSLVDNEKYLTLLDEQVAPYSPTFKEDMFKLWNVYYDEEPKIIDDYLLSYLKMQSNEFNFSREITDVLGQLFLLKMLKLLDGMNEEGAKIKLEFKLLIEKYRPQFADIDENFTLQKILMDNVLFTFGGLTLLLKKKEGADILQEYATPLKNIKDKSVPVEIKKTEKPKEEEKAKTKPASEKSGGKQSDSPKAPAIKPNIVDYSKAFGSAKKPEAKKKTGGGTPIKIATSPLAKPAPIISREVPKAPAPATNVEKPKEPATTKVNDSGKNSQNPEEGGYSYGRIKSFEGKEGQTEVYGTNKITADTKVYDNDKIKDVEGKKAGKNLNPFVEKDMSR